MGWKKARMRQSERQKHRTRSSERNWRTIRRAKSRAGIFLGPAKEDYVLHILRFAERQSLVKKALKSRHRGEWDNMGWDIVILDLEGKLHPLQVKSSALAAIEFQKTHPGIPVIVASLNDDPQEVVNALKAIFPFLKELRPEND